MEKTYKIIPLNNYLYAIDEETDVNEGDWCIHFGKGFTNKILHDQNTLVKITEKQLCGKNGGHGWFWKQWDKNPQFHYSHNELKKIIASNNPSLNVPILPDIEVDAKSFLLSKYKHARDVDNFGASAQLLSYNQVCRLMEDYAEAKKYSEEDMKGFTKWLLNMYKPVKGGWRHRGAFSDKFKPVLIENLMKEYIKSLSPIPKAVELEMEEFYTPPVNPFWKLKLTNNNQVIVKQFIYEKV